MTNAERLREMAEELNTYSPRYYDDFITDLRRIADALDGLEKINARMSYPEHDLMDAAIGIGHEASE